MNKYLFFLLILMFNYGTINLKAQSPYYDLEKDKSWVDSLKIFTKEKFAYSFNDKFFFRYFDAAATLGLYYEKLYKFKKTKNNQLAVFYFEKITAFSKFSYYQKYFKLSALRNTINRKLATFYFDGNGVKRKREKSLQLALEGTSGVDGFFEYYSKKYFGCKCVFLSEPKTFDLSKDTIFTFRINPFAHQANLIKLKIFGNKFENIIKIYEQRQISDTALKIHLSINAFPSMSAQANANRLIDNIKQSLVNRFKVDENKIIINVQVEEEKIITLDVVFSKFDYFLN